MDSGQNGSSGAVQSPRRPHVELPPDIYAQLAQAAAENQRSIAGEARYALSLYLRNIEKRRAATA